MRMAKFVFPDPDDRSKNNPCIIIDNDKVLGLYNQDHEPEERMQKVTQKVQGWIKDRATELGWDNVKFAGGQCILENEFKK